MRFETRFISSKISTFCKCFHSWYRQVNASKADGVAVFTLRLFHLENSVWNPMENVRQRQNGIKSNEPLVRVACIILMHRTDVNAKLFHASHNKANNSLSDENRFQVGEQGRSTFFKLIWLPEQLVARARAVQMHANT